MKWGSAIDLSEHFKTPDKGAVSCQGLPDCQTAIGLPPGSDASDKKTSPFLTTYSASINELEYGAHYRQAPLGSPG